MAAGLEQLNAAVEQRLTAKVRRENAAAALDKAHFRFLEKIAPLADDAYFNVVVRSEHLTLDGRTAVASRSVATSMRCGSSSTCAPRATSRSGCSARLRACRMRVRWSRCESGLWPQSAISMNCSPSFRKRRRRAASGRTWRRSSPSVATKAGSLPCAQKNSPRRGGAAFARGQPVARRPPRTGSSTARYRRDSGSDAAALRSAEAIRIGKLLLPIITALGIVGAPVILLQYVLAQIVRPIEKITAAMTGLAAGNTGIAIPGRDRHDEVGRMAEALAVFRDTAVEIEEKNLREVATARERLIDAIESISDGFALWDRDDRLVMFNMRSARSPELAGSLRRRRPLRGFDPAAPQPRSLRSRDRRSQRMVRTTGGPAPQCADGA